MLVFYYLIPDTLDQEREVKQLKSSCRLAQASIYSKQKRFIESLKELAQLQADIALFCKHCPSDSGLFENMLKLAQNLKATVQLKIGDLEGAEKTV